jgi:hypothetical protein
MQQQKTNCLLSLHCRVTLLPQVLQYRGIPFKPKRQGLLNSSGLNEGIVQGTNFKTSVFPLQYESALERPVRTGFTGAQSPLRLCVAPCVTLRGGGHIAVPFHLFLQQPTILHHPLPAGNRVEVKKVDAYQYTLTPDSGLQCNQTLYATWKNDTGFDMDAFAGLAWSACCHHRCLPAASHIGATSMGCHCYLYKSIGQPPYLPSGMFNAGGVVWRSR